MSGGHTEVGELRDDPSGVGQDHRAVVALAERPGPAVEHLVGAGAGEDLGANRRDREVGQPLHEVVPEARIVEHQRLRLGVVPGGATLDEVRRHRERCAGEADERDVELAGEDAHGLEHVGGVDLGLEGPKALEIGAAGERLLDDGADAGLHVDAEADALGRDDDVAVEDGGVDAVAPDGLQRDLGRQFRVAQRVEDAAFLADLAVLGEAAAGLALEPHRDAIVRLGTARSEIGAVGEAVGRMVGGKGHASRVVMRLGRGTRRRYRRQLPASLAAVVRLTRGRVRLPRALDCRIPRIWTTA